MFDVASLDTRTLSEAGVAMPILNPRNQQPMLDSAGNPVTVTLLGPNSEKSKAVFRGIQTRRADFAAKGVRMTEADFDRERFDALVALTIGWTFTAIAGQPFPFSAENARILWADKRWDWLQTSAFVFCQQDGNYLPSS